MIGSPHYPARGCSCTSCRLYYDQGWAVPFNDAQHINQQRRAALDRMPMLPRMQAENRPHLRDPAFLKFMAKVVGNTLRK